MNAPLLSVPGAEPFFFDADPGTRFSIYHAATPLLPIRGAILYVHPFAEELNFCRRMAALQSRQFAALGYAVLQIDLFGCGDSCGDFQAARWEIWQRDLGTALAWLAERCSGPLYLWGVRLGALLALDFARANPVDGLIFWQPLLSGRSAINQFLRQHPLIASGVHTSAAMRAQLVAKSTLEVNGYELAAPLASAIDACDASAMQLPACEVHWFSSGNPAPLRLSASAARLARRWADSGASVQVHSVQASAFWTGEAAECPSLQQATSAVFAMASP